MARKPRKADDPNRAAHETAIRAQTPYVEVCDNGECQRWEPGEPEYEAWIVRTVDAHVTADAAMAAQELAG